MPERGISIWRTPPRGTKGDEAMPPTKETRAERREREERELMESLYPPEEMLPFPTRPLKTRDGMVEEYIIPDDKKREVLESMCVFKPPKLGDTILDMHEGKSFVAREFRVVRENNQNFLVSPYYPTSGGTVIDWSYNGPDDEEEEG
jgi:hypothetical protein